MGDDRHPALGTLEDLIGIQSVNPFFGEDAKGEREVADYVEVRCREAGLEVSRQQVFPGRENVIAELRVGKPEATLLFEAHMDTVPLGSMEDPLVPRYRDGRLYGRGACDTKGSLAAMMHAVEECAKDPDGLSGDVVLCATVDEERAYRGVLALVDSEITAAGAVVGEPTESRIVVTHKGCARFLLKARGKAAHSSVPHEGDNAIYQMVEVLDFLKREIEPGLPASDHPLSGPATMVVATIRGGTQINIVPEGCEIEVDRRVVPGEDPRRVLEDIEGTLRRRFDGSGVDISLQELLLDWPLDTSPESTIVRSARRAAAGLGLDGTPRGATYGSDASKLQQLKGIPSIVFGPGSITQAHSREEWVPTEEVGRAAEFYAEVARGFGHDASSGA